MICYYIALWACWILHFINDNYYYYHRVLFLYWMRKSQSPRAWQVLGHSVFYESTCPIRILVHDNVKNELNINRHAAVSCNSSEIPLATSEVTLVLLYVIWAYNYRFYIILWLICFKPFVISVLCISSLLQSIRGGGCSKHFQVKPWYTRAHKSHLEAVQTNSTNTGTKK